MCLYCSFTDILLIVSYPKMMLNEKAADWTRRADRPLKNIWNCSSLQSSLAAFEKESKRWTCRRARMMSSGFVIIVVVKPPKAPAMHCISKWDVFAGKTLISSSKKRRAISRSTCCAPMADSYLDTRDRNPTKVRSWERRQVSLLCSLCNTPEVRLAWRFPEQCELQCRTLCLQC